MTMQLVNIYGEPLDLLIFGPPGVGKGTQVDLTKEVYDFTHISTGNLFRDEIARGTALGMQAKPYMDAGDYVPDGITIEMVRGLLKSRGSRGSVFDGFPRTPAQAEALDNMLDDLNREIDGVLFLDAPDEIIIPRASGRWLCTNAVECGKIYHAVFSPPQVVGRCDVCGSPLYQRDDDKVEVVTERTKKYRATTTPLLKLYLEKGQLWRLTGSFKPEVIQWNILECIHSIAQYGS